MEYHEDFSSCYFHLWIHSQLMWCRFSRRVNSLRATFRAWPRTCSTASLAFPLTSWLSLPLFNYLHFFFPEQSQHQPFWTLDSSFVNWNCLIFLWVWLSKNSNLACTHLFLLHFTKSLSHSMTLNSKNYTFTERIWRVKWGFLMIISHFIFAIFGGVVHSLF